MSIAPGRVYGVWKRFQELFGRYHAGMPQGSMASYATEESGGHQVCAGDDPNGETSCGGQGAPLYEYGIFQITAKTEARFGVPAGFRKTLEGNFWLAGTEQNVEAALASQDYGVAPGSKDAWLLAFLVFAIGKAGVNHVWAAARSAGYPATYAGLYQWADDTGAIQVNTQTPSTVERRIKIAVSNWNDGIAAGLPMTYGMPFLTPAPFGIGYNHPLSDVPKTEAQLRGLIAAGRLAPYGGIGDADGQSAAGLVAVGVLAAIIGRAFA